MIVCLLLILCSLARAQTVSKRYTVLFSDVPSLTSMDGQGASITNHTGEPDIPAVAANDWLKQQGWQQVWPPVLLGRQELFFAGPYSQRFLRLEADNTSYILARKINLDPHSLPWLTITWGIERFPEAASMEEYKRGDHAIAVLVSFGEKLPSSGLLPDVPRALAFFWGETENVGGNYTCVTPRNGPADVRMHCKFPHVKYIALRRGDAGRVHSDRVNLVRYFQENFPDYWQQHQQAPPIVGISLEAASRQTQTVSSARLYRLDFAAGEPGGDAVKTK
jgi:hypothetical protein